MKTKVVSSFRGMEYGYVYYPSLIKKPTNSKSRAIGMEVVSRLRNLSNVSYQKAITTNIGVELLTMARAEREKELRFLENVFGVSLQYDFTSPNFDSEFIEALSQTMQLKKVLDRFIARYNNKNMKTTDYAVFGKHLYDAWTSNIPNLEQLLNMNLSADANKILLMNYINNNIIPQALTSFLSISSGLSKETLSKVNEGGYDELLNQLNSLKNQATKNTLISQISDFYHLDSVAKAITEDFLNLGNVDIHQISKNNKKLSTGYSHQHGGSIAEFLMNATLSIIGDNKFNIGQNDLVTVTGQFKSIHTGGKQYKDDILLSVGLNSQVISNMLLNLKDKGSVSRERNVKIYKELQQKTNKLKNGSIMHGNFKDYGKTSYNKTGFQAESDISLGTFRNIMKNMASNSDSLIGAICQTIPGALGEGNKAFLEELLAADIAYFLFDDVRNIGVAAENLPGIRGNEIHLFFLSGFWFPLSILLDKLGAAFLNFENDINSKEERSSYANVTIKTPPHLRFQEKEDDYLRDEPVTWLVKDWSDQRIDALERIKINAHFLKGIDELLRPVFGRSL